MLLAVYSLAAPWSSQIELLKINPPWHVGDQFALAAMREIFVEDATREYGFSPPDSLDSLRIGPSLEVAQTLCLLQVHEAGMRRASGRSDGFLPLAIQVLRQLDAFNIDMPSNNKPDDYATFVKNESMRRTIWLIFFIESLSSGLTGREGQLLRQNLNAIRLPMEEAHFELPRRDTRTGTEQRFEYLRVQPIDDGHRCKSEFANLTRIAGIYGAVARALATRSMSARHLGLTRLTRSPLEKAMLEAGAGVNVGFDANHIKALEAEFAVGVKSDCVRDRSLNQDCRYGCQPSLSSCA